MDQGERILRKRQRQNYPGVGTRSRPRPIVEDVEDEDEHRPAEPPVEIEIDLDEPDTPVKETEAGKGIKKRVPRKEGEIQPGRKVPVQLCSEAEPEKMVNKILNQNIDGITVREVLALSPDLLKEL